LPGKGGVYRTDLLLLAQRQIWWRVIANALPGLALGAEERKVKAS